MAFLPVYNCFNPILKKKTEPIKNIDSKINKLIDDMFETMYEAEGVGLAANQVGQGISLIVIDTAPNTEAKHYPPIVLINPIITSRSDEEIEFQEGCLSVPGIHEYVKRPEAIEVKFLDKNGKENVIEANDYLARVVQHEYDHLKGILFFERFSPLRRTLVKSKLKKIQRGQMAADYPMIDPMGKLVK